MYIYIYTHIHILERSESAMSHAYVRHTNIRMHTYAYMSSAYIYIYIYIYIYTHTHIYTYMFLPAFNRNLQRRRMHTYNTCIHTIHACYMYKHTYIHTYTCLQHIFLTFSIYTYICQEYIYIYIYIYIYLYSSPMIPSTSLKFALLHSVIIPMRVSTLYFPSCNNNKKRQTDRGRLEPEYRCLCVCAHITCI
jgi:hypothetical protein